MHLAGVSTSITLPHLTMCTIQYFACYIAMVYLQFGLMHSRAPCKLSPIHCHAPGTAVHRTGIPHSLELTALFASMSLLLTNMVLSLPCFTAQYYWVITLRDSLYNEQVVPAAARRGSASPMVTHH